jgi:ABC-type multidrug transport system ATPase subunit
MSHLPAVKLNGVSKRYCDVTAVDYLDLEVRRGEVFGLLGPNGSGKSTTLKLILGLVKPDSGSVNVLGINVEDDPVAVKRKIGYVPEAPRIYEFLTALEFLDFTGDVYGKAPEERKKRIEEFVRALDLEGRLHNEASDEANRTAKFISTEITAEDTYMQFYSLSYMVQHAEYNLTLYTTLTPLESETYNSSFTVMNYAQLENPD